MELVRRVHQMREICREASGKGRKLALVPTMGALHDGHLSLVRRARELADVVIVSIFVNPAQFGPSEDYEKYPRDLARDADLAIQEGVDYLFAPDAEDVYPPGFATFVDVAGLSSVLEGSTRPGHFRGVCTIVVKLLNIVRPHFALFGQKDAQQLSIVERVARELNMDVEVVACETIRDADGLALSSRNAFLSEEERKAASVLWESLQHARELVEKEGQTQAVQIEKTIRQRLDGEALARIDYVAIVDSERLEPVEEIKEKTLVLLAVWVGETRLIDNLVLSPTRSFAGESSS